MVAFLSLISKNEEMDDVATTDLKYILVDCYQGILHQKGEQSKAVRSDYLVILSEILTSG